MNDETPKNDDRIPDIDRIEEERFLARQGFDAAQEKDLIDLHKFEAKEKEDEQDDSWVENATQF